MITPSIISYEARGSRLKSRRRNEISQTLLNERNLTINSLLLILYMYHKTLGYLAREKSIKISSFDEGSGLVNLNSEDYYKKLDKIVNDKSKFSLIF